MTLLEKLVFTNVLGTHAVVINERREIIGIPGLKMLVKGKAWSSLYSAPRTRERVFPGPAIV